LNEIGLSHCRDAVADAKSHAADYCVAKVETGSRILTWQPFVFKNGRICISAMN